MVELSEANSNVIEYMDEINEDVIRGRESGFPGCCIKFFSEVWAKECNFSNHLRDPNQWTISYGRTHPSVGYIMCPECRAKD